MEKAGIREMGNRGLELWKKYGTAGLWAGLLFGLGFTFCGFFYGDVEATFDNTVLMVKSIGEGEFFRFYEYSLAHASTYWPAGYDILLYVFFAVWNLPSILLHLFTGFNYLESPLALLWCKGLGGVFAVAMGWAVYQMAGLLEAAKEKRWQAVFLLLSSLSLTAPVFVAGQYDTLPLFFMLLGLYFYLKDGKKGRKGFYLCFCISIPLKVYGLFLLLPLILLKEKRVWAILIKTIGCCLPYAALKLLFAGDSVYPFISGSQGQYGTNKLLDSALEYSGYSLCLFLGCYAAICIYCYWKQLEDEREQLVWPVYICFLVFAAFAVLVAINDYWIVFWLPFGILLMLMNPGCYKINLLIETVASGMYLLYAFIQKVYPYSYPELVTERFFGLFMKVPDEELRLYGSVKELMAQLGLQPYAQLVHTLFAVGLVSLVVLNRPGIMLRKEKEAQKAGQSASLQLSGDNDSQAEEEQKASLPALKVGQAQGKETEEAGLTGILWSRVGMVLAVALLLVYANLKSGNPVSYSTLQKAYQHSGVNLLEGAVYTQQLEFEADRSLQELVLYFTNDGYVKDNFGSVWIRLTEQDSGRLLFEKRLGASVTDPGQPSRIALENTEVQAGAVYILSLEGEKGMEGSSYFFSPWITEGFHSGYPLIINGEYQDCNLYMQIR